MNLDELELSAGLASFEQIENVITELLERDVVVLSLGGDHAITYPLLKAYRKKYDPERDPPGVTAMVAAKLLKEIAARMLELN